MEDSLPKTSAQHNRKTNKKKAKAAMIPTPANNTNATADKHR